MEPRHDQHYEIVERCLKGDRRAQFELYGLYSKAMYNLCLRLTENATEAEDALQNAFVEVFTKMHTFRFESSVGAWIKRIVVNTSINQLKRRKTLDELNEERHDQPDASGDDHGVAEDTQWQVSVVKDAIHNLPDGYRVVLSLYLLEGYDHEEIGQILGISEQTSKSQYSRAKARLREQLGDYRAANR